MEGQNREDLGVQFLLVFFDELIDLFSSRAKAKKVSFELNVHTTLVVKNLFVYHSLDLTHCLIMIPIVELFIV